MRLYALPDTQCGIAGDVMETESGDGRGRGGFVAQRVPPVGLAGILPAESISPIAKKPGETPAGPTGWKRCATFGRSRFHLRHSPPSALRLPRFVFRTPRSAFRVPWAARNFPLTRAAPENTDRAP